MNDHPLTLAAHVTYRQQALLADAEASRLARQVRATRTLRPTPSRWVGVIQPAGWLLRVRLLLGALTAR